MVILLPGQGVYEINFLEEKVMRVVTPESMTHVLRVILFEALRA